MLFSENHKKNNKINKRKIGFVLGTNLKNCEPLKYIRGGK